MLRAEATQLVVAVLIYEKAAVGVFERNCCC